MVDNERENAAEGRNHVFVPQYRSGGCTVRGIRQTLEDALICVDDLHDQLQSRGAFYGVFDGHDGAAAALYAKDNLLSFILHDSLFPTSVEEAVKKEFLRLDRDFLEACQRDSNLHSGTTALIALLQTSEAAIIFARRQLRMHNDPERCSKALVREALKRNAQDNITVITVCFQADAPPDLAVVETRSTRKINLESMLFLQDHLDIAEESRRTS